MLSTEVGLLVGTLKIRRRRIPGSAAANVASSTPEVTTPGGCRPVGLLSWKERALGAFFGVAVVPPRALPRSDVDQPLVMRSIIQAASAICSKAAATSA